MKRATLTIVVTSLLAPLSVGAQKLSNPTPGGGATLQDFIALLIEIIQAVGIPALVLAIIYSGFILLTAGGNEQQIDRKSVV